MRIPRHVMIGLLIVCVLGCLSFTFWAGWHSYETKNDAQECRSLGKFGQIECCLRAYHKEHRAFPPTRYRARPDWPLHSWRVLLVPYTDVDYKQRFSKYDFSQEWNSTTNLEALGHMPQFTYFNAGNDRDVANYVALGEGDEWPVKRALRSYAVTEGKDTFLLFEYPDSKVNWMEPRY
jgi:hypothetical protein